jgi:hypothetical protein
VLAEATGHDAHVEPLSRSSQGGETISPIPYRNLKASITASGAEAEGEGCKNPVTKADAGLQRATPPSAHLEALFCEPIGNRTGCSPIGQERFG